MPLQPVASFAGQREGAVLVVGDARVPEHAAVLLEVGLVGDGASPVDGGTGAPAARTASLGGELNKLTNLRESGLNK